MNYDSETETRKHIAFVGMNMLNIIRILTERIEWHDYSKLSVAEKSIFDEFTPKLAKCTYGSEEYKGFLAEMKPALDNHYKANRHHPEHFENGINQMTLIDIIEMLCDWKAATLRHNDGDIYKSIALNKKRFGYTDELERILFNTAKSLGF